MGEGDWKGEVGAPELSEQVESPNKTYLFHLRSVCALHGWGGERVLSSSRSWKLCLKDAPPWEGGHWIGRACLEHPCFKVVLETWACKWLQITCNVEFI